MFRDQVVPSVPPGKESADQSFKLAILLVKPQKRSRLRLTASYTVDRSLIEVNVCRRSPRGLMGLQEDNKTTRTMLNGTGLMLCRAASVVL
jgi:hypothetical protein